MAAVMSEAASIDDVQHFKSIPWCAKHLATPDLVLMRSWGRTLGQGLRDSLFAVTLNTPYTVASILAFYPDPDASAGPAGPQSPPVEEIKTLISLGPLISGFAGVCHGGIVMAILDEVLSTCLHVNRQRGVIKARNTKLMTAYLNTTFLRPVEVPGTYLVRSRLQKVEGRKAFGTVWIEDENGAKLATADGLFVMIREKL
ncbi:hypothetical protein VPNG_02155 [Cytospora leucostoma]|uniref:Thioesterase domain-containing protein n=1 Tax=Cytospora leucostoma TaxID=1230097 RepID=A0A423XHW2_9PEZI|nr:hypothetical protein VPNG_02155 [Cytospora leucostoma]